MTTTTKTTTEETTTEKTVHVPLPFWYCKDSKMSIAYIRDWKFQRYPSIDNITQSVLNTGRFGGLEDQQEWYVQEKVHGCNVSFWCNGQDVRSARRNGWILKEETFFTVTETMNQYNSLGVFTNLYDQMIESGDLQPSECLIIYGEFYGGYFLPQPDPHFKPVQKEIQYSPKHRFICFDIAVAPKETAATMVVSGNYEHCDEESQTSQQEPESQSTLKFLNLDKIQSLCASVRLPFCPVLFRGSFKECIEFSKENYEKQTTLVDLDLSALNFEGNIREGHVIRRVIPRHGQYKRGELGSALKHKNSKFSERKTDKMDKTVVSQELSTGTRAAFNFIVQFLTTNRLKNIESKLPEDRRYTSKDIRDAMSELIKDAMEEINILEEWTTVYRDAIVPTEKYLMDKEIRTVAAKIVREYIVGSK